MKAFDTEHQFFGYGGQPAICRVQVYLLDGQPPLVVCVELVKNPGTSVTNMLEYLAAEVTERYLTADDLAGDPPFLWLEVYERDEDARRARILPSWSLATFSDYTRRPTHTMRPSPGRRYRLGSPAWRHLRREEFAAIVGRYGGDERDQALGDYPPGREMT